MPEVNPSRRYDATGRRRAARSSRLAVLEAARGLMESQGYRATTIAGIADRAGVSAESVYKTWRTKAALTKAVFDLVIAGDDEDVPVAQRPEVAAIRAEPEVRRKLALYVDQAVVRAARSAPIQLVVRNGQHADPALRDLWRTVLDERLAGMTMVARHLLGTGDLRAAIEEDEVRDVLWTYTSVEVYDLLVLERGWDAARFGAWVLTGLEAALLDG